MTDYFLESSSWSVVSSQPSDVLKLFEFERDALIISATQVEGRWVILSRYGDDVWQLEGFASNVPPSMKKLDFSTVPQAFKVVMKAMMYRYLRRGRRGGAQPKGAILKNTLSASVHFLRHLEALKLDHLGAVTPLVCSTYVAACKAHRQTTRSKGKPLAQSGLHKRLIAVEAIHELSQFTHDPMPQHPWPETSAKAMAGLVGAGSKGGKTPLMPDDVFCTLFERAYQYVEHGQKLLDLRDELDAIAAQQVRKGRTQPAIDWAKRQHLSAQGWSDGQRAFNRALLDLRTASYIILASTSGCRNHELTNLQSGAHHRTQDDQGTIYHWMRSRSEKTDTRIHDWMIPEVAVRTLRLMENWAAPYQAMIASEIEQRRRINPHDPEIAEAHKHRNSLFLGVYYRENNRARTLSSTSWGATLISFAKTCGLSWNLTSHQFRRKFANYAAHSKFGDLRYLKEHFAHWSLDMSLGYAIDDSWGQHLDLELYDEIQTELKDIKLGVVDGWFGDKTLAGGYGQSLNHWQREPQNLLIFKSRSAMVKSISESTSIRSNGHAWCTADDGGCIGNTIERTRCGNGCSNAVIGSSHMPFYQRLYDDLKELRHCSDIGEGGRQRVERDLNRCRDVLVQLGIDSEKLIA
ncbi:integrase [Pseudomonas sp. Gutcm_11s]|uniref:integrase n=1 Tax=Pseudomonas sp. Gutcm_11s TaxID=3026088 RepID=UPI0023609AEC|nr:integrase [Pseudomonas sp. Gutcm_11s]MDD0841408.1 integrase [Pseudomonas sp. Gutcm_11s]